MLLVKNFLDGQELDDSTASLVECAAFLHGVVGEGEGNVEAALDFGELSSSLSPRAEGSRAVPTG
jgi:hypothetical protein